MVQTLESRITSIPNGRAMLELFLRNCVQMPRREAHGQTSGEFESYTRMIYTKAAHWISTLRGTDASLILSLYEGCDQNALYLEMFMDVPGSPWGTMASFGLDGDLRFSKSTIYGESASPPILVPNEHVHTFSWPSGLVAVYFHTPPPDKCTYVTHETGELHIRSVGQESEQKEGDSLSDNVVRVPEKHFGVLKRLPYFAEKVKKMVRAT